MSAPPDLSQAIRPRALEAQRADVSTQFNVMVGNAGGGQLNPLIQEYYMGESTCVGRRSHCHSWWRVYEISGLRLGGQIRSTYPSLKPHA